MKNIQKNACCININKKHGSISKMSGLNKRSVVKKQIVVIYNQSIDIISIIQKITSSVCVYRVGSLGHRLGATLTKRIG